MYRDRYTTRRHVSETRKARLRARTPEGKAFGRALIFEIKNRAFIAEIRRLLHEPGVIDRLLEKEKAATAWGEEQ